MENIMLSSIRTRLSRIFRHRSRDYDTMSVPAKLIYLSLLPTGLIYLIARLSPTFADFFNRYISQPLRLLYAKLTNFLPISFEIYR